MALKQTARDVLWVAGGNYVALLAGIPLGLITPLFLAPAAYGIIAIADYVAEFLRHYPLGALAATGREVPLLRERGEPGAADDARDAAWTLTVLLGLPAAILPAAVAHWVVGSPRDLSLALLLAGIATVAWRFGEFHSVLLRCGKQFREDSRVTMIASLLQLALLPLCLWRFGVPGYFVSSLAVAVASYGLWRSASGERLRLRLPHASLGALLAFGIPMAILDISDTAVGSLDRVLLQRVFSLEALGLYFFAYKFHRYLITLPQAVALVAQRNLLSRLAKEEEQACGETVHVPAQYVAWGTALLIGCAAALLPALVNLVYPRFNAAAPALRVFLVAAWWPAVGAVYFRHLVATKRLGAALACSAVAIGAAATGFLVFGARLDLRGAALIAAGGLAIRAMLATGISTAALARGAAEIPIRIARLLPPFAFVVALAWSFERQAWPGGTLSAAMLQTLASVLLFGPALFWLQKRHPLVEE